MLSACREGGGGDDDCCAGAGEGGCAQGYSLSFKNSAQWGGKRPSQFYPKCDAINGGKGNTCCTKAGGGPPTPTPPPPIGSVNQPACRARVYEAPGTSCDGQKACAPWGAGGTGKCCGKADGFCPGGSGDGDFVSADALGWVDLAARGCTGGDFIRVSDGCGVEVSIGGRGTYTNQTYQGDANLGSSSIGYDKAKWIRLFRITPRAPTPAPPTPAPPTPGPPTKATTVS